MSEGRGLSWRDAVGIGLSLLAARHKKLGWFRTTFAMAGRTCREAVDRVPCTRAVLTEGDCEILMPEVNERKRFRRGLREITLLAVAVLEGDVDAMVWLMQLFDEKGLEWRYDSGTGLSLLAAERGKIESLTCLRANGCPWDAGPCARAAYDGRLAVLQWGGEHGSALDEVACAAAAELYKSQRASCSPPRGPVRCSSPWASRARSGASRCRSRTRLSSLALSSSSTSRRL